MNKTFIVEKYIECLTLEDLEDTRRHLVLTNKLLDDNCCYCEYILDKYNERYDHITKELLKYIPKDVIKYIILKYLMIE